MEVLIPSSVRNRMKWHLLRVGKREIGGILMGEEVGHHRFKIVEFSVDTESGSPLFFVRNADHHERELQAFFERTGADYSRFNYLGEWHSHPIVDAYPSVKDLHSMQDLVERSQGVHFAILLVARLRWFCWFESTATLFIRSHQPRIINLVVL